jgi:hypothetical protein
MHAYLLNPRLMRRHRWKGPRNRSNELLLPLGPGIPVAATTSESNKGGLEQLARVVGCLWR